MDIKILMAVIAMATVTIGQPLADQVQIATNRNIIPGIFIPADVLKELQEKTEHNPINEQGSQIDNQPILAQNSQEPVANPPMVNQPGNLKAEDLSVKINQAKLLAEAQNQQQLLTSRQPELVNQPVLLNQQQLFANRQPTSSNQQQIFNQQPIPNQQSFVLTQQQALPNQQAILVTQQPGLPNQQPILLNQQPTQGIVLQNGQFAQIRPLNSQTTLFTTNPLNNQAALIKSVNVNPVQNPGQTTIYAVVPVLNGQNVPNSANGNTYLMPVQQMTNPTMYSFNTAK